MAELTKTLTGYTALPGGGHLLTFGKRGREFPSLAALRDFVRDTLTPDVLEALMLRIMLDRQPAFGNPAAFVGRTLTADTAQANVMVVS